MYSKNPKVVIANDFNKFIHSIRKMTARTATQIAIENDINMPTGTDYYWSHNILFMNCLILPQVPKLALKSST